MIHTFKQRRNSMAQQSSDGGRPKLSEKGLLTPDNCVVALIDHQPQMLFGVSNFDRQGIINNVVALSKAARVFDLPVVSAPLKRRASAAISGRKSRRSSRNKYRLSVLP